MHILFTNNYGLIFEDTISSKVTEEIVVTLQLDKKNKQHG